MGSYPYPRNGILNIDYEFILIFKKLGTPSKPTKEQKELSKLSKDEWNLYFSGHWNFAGVKQDKHLAMFPEELPKRLIKMFSFAKDVVLDPFLGSGTTSLVAKNLVRNSVGYEINAEFLPHIKNRLNSRRLDLEGTEYIFLQDNNSFDVKDEIKGLPYIFKDPHKLNNKIDPRKLQFGSKINNLEVNTEKYYSVKKIISPELLELNNDLVIRLLGIKEKQVANGDAVKFLMEKTKGQKVFLRYDEQKYDEQNNLLCYLYLKNKTFINAHLIKKGLAEVDSSSTFKYKEKFLKINF